MTTTAAASAIPEFAAIIIDQLGGGRIFSMAFEFVTHSASERTVMFHIAKALRRTTTDKITHVQVKLEGDLYEVTFYAVRGLNWTIKATVSMVYGDSLRATVEAHTGLRMRLF